MKIDIVFPKNNEKKFIELAEKLGWEGLCFVYKETINKKLLEEIITKTKLKIFIAGKKGILKIAKSTEKDQRILEKSAPDVLYGMEFFAKKDPMHFRSSGLNQVLCKLAKKNKVVIAVPLKPIIDSKDKTLILGRIIQNITLCKKYKVMHAISSFAEKPYEMKSPNDMISFMVSLGMAIPEAKKSVNILGEKIKDNLKKQSSDYIREGIKILQ